MGERAQRIASRWITIALLLLAALNGPSGVWAEEEAELTALARRMETLFAEERLSEAIETGEALLAGTRRSVGDNHPDVAAILSILAKLHFHNNEPEKAGPLLREALSIRERTQGADHPQTVDVQESLVVLYMARQRWADAERLLETVLTRRQAQLGPDNPRIAKYLDNLAQVNLQLGRLPEAEELFRQGLAIRQQAQNQDPATAQDSLVNLADLSARSGDLTQAETQYQQALEAAAQGIRQFHLKRATVFFNLGVMKWRAGRNREGDGLFSKALAEAREVFGDDSAPLTQWLEELEQDPLHQGYRQRAHALLQRTLAAATANPDQSGGGGNGDENGDRAESENGASSLNPVLTAVDASPPPEAAPSVADDVAAVASSDSTQGALQETPSQEEPTPVAQEAQTAPSALPSAAEPESNAERNAAAEPPPHPTQPDASLPASLAEPVSAEAEIATLDAPVSSTQPPPNRPSTAGGQPTGIAETNAPTQPPPMESAPTTAADSPSPITRPPEASPSPSQASHPVVPGSESAANQRLPRRGERYIPLGCFGAAENARQAWTHIHDAGLAGFETETNLASGTAHCVSAGPFADREAARAARERLQATRPNASESFEIWRSRKNW